MSGLSLPSGLATFTRTFTVRVAGSTVGSMKAMRPWKTSPG